MSSQRVSIRVACSALFLLAFSLLPAVKADAGDYTLKQCLGAEFRGFSGEYFNINTLDRVDNVVGCQPGQPTRLSIAQDRSGRPVQGFGGGQFLWSPDPSIRITGTTFSARLKDVDGMRAQLIGPRSAGGQTMLDEGLPHDGQVRTMRWSGDNPSLAPALVVARLICVWVDGCENNPDTAKAYLEIYDMEIQSRDFMMPELEVSGPAWEGRPGDWIRGGVAFRTSSADRGSGVSAVEARVNGLTVDLPAVSCPDDRGSYVTAFSPCPAAVERAGTLDTSHTPFRDGDNSLSFCVSDFAIPSESGNRRCTVQRTLLVDNSAPLAPSGLAVEGGSDWRASNGFELSWQTPSGQDSPIVSAEYRVVDINSGLQVEEGSVQGEGLTSIGPIEVPAPGEFRVEVRLRDQAGNLGAPADAVIRFDDSPPGDVGPEQPGGWISDDELPLEQPIERAVAGGPSGIEGYAIAVDSSGPSRPCATDVCSPAELALSSGPDSRTVRISNLTEGNHWVSAVAASGARLSSRRPGSTLLKVDRTDPETSVSGIPDGWVNQPVTVTAEASDALSGMDAEPGTDDGEPMVVIAAEGHSPFESPGHRSSFTLAAEGISTVRYWAMDLAGNVNDGRIGPDGVRHDSPESTSVRIDMTPPEMSFLAGDPDQPELVAVDVSDSLSGVQSARVELRRLGQGGPFIPLRSRLADGLLQARVPSDDLPAGTYEVRASAIDRAGNSAASVSREDGSAMILNLPLKRPVTVSLRSPSRGTGTKSLTLAYGQRPRLAGRVSRPGGTGIPGARLILEQRFEAGSRVGLTTSSIRADGTGRFAVSLKPGPGRLVRVLYRGSDLDTRAASRRLAISFRDRTTLNLSPGVLRNGSLATMRGVVKGRAAIQPAGGKLVAIEFYDPGRRRWRPVEVLRADRRGRFRYSYRFRTITSAQRILFRAASLPEAGWPYRPSTSKPKSVIVYPGSR
jgi:hypothetical protein